MGDAVLDVDDVDLEDSKKPDAVDTPRRSDRNPATHERKLPDDVRRRLLLSATVWIITIADDTRSAHLAVERSHRWASQETSQ
jgi:hypothetical protein